MALYLRALFFINLIFLAHSFVQANDNQKPILLDKIPSHIMKEMLPTGHFIGHADLAWNAAVLTVAFEGGSPHVYNLIESTAKEWTDNGNLKLSFRKQDGTFRTWTSSDTVPAADIRISFRGGKDGGYWSVLGSLAENVAPHNPTMNFEGFDVSLKKFSNNTSKSWLESYSRSTISHEFGHAFGLAHEHFHDDCQNDLLIDKAVSELMQHPNNWSELQARFNIDASEYNKIMHGNHATDPTVSSNKIDQKSIMLYTLNQSHFISGNKSPCKSSNRLGYATKLSDKDKKYYNSIYSNISSPF